MSKLDQLKALREARTASRNNSDGGVGSRHAERQVTDSLHLAGREKPQRSGESGSSAIRQVRAKVQAGTQSPKVASAGVAPGPSEPTRKRGRPRIGETRDKPWEAAGMSERTWYRRQKDKAK